MVTVPLKTVAQYCDRLLHTDRFEDWSGASNGLQVENRGAVTRLAAAVDASFGSLRLAMAARVDLLIVHHGLFWSPASPWTGRKYELLRLLLDHNLAVYSSHLPLDAHPVVGNNAQICRALGLRSLRPFLYQKNCFVGFQSNTRLARETLVRRFEKAIGRSAVVVPFGPSVCRRIGVVSGGGGAELKLAADEGVDTFITGEGPHWTFNVAEELGLNLIYGGHYATEAFGVKALAAHVSRKFGVPWQFIDRPTGL